VILGKFLIATLVVPHAVAVLKKLGQDWRHDLYRGSDSPGHPCNIGERLFGLIVEINHSPVGNVLGIGQVRRLA
jgi:hypothetical protein